ncbi:MAG TPA: NlpC/P60 family protein [Ilumatobacteraceae bacterium]|nr:NlpC/P60 family protein [Ilumatobacteraceae bacterium]
MRSRGSLHRSVAALIAVGSLLSTATVSHADDVGSQKAKVNQLAVQLNNLENRLGQLDEDYGAAQDRKAQLDQQIAESQARIAEQQGRLDQLAGVLGDIAVDKYVTGSALELSPLFSNAQAYTEAEQKDSLSRLALDNGSGSTDEMQALAEDLAKEQASLSDKQKQVAGLVDTLNSKLAEGQALQTEYEQKLASAKVELGAAIDQERERLAEVAAAAEIARQKQIARDAAAANKTSAVVVTTPRGGGATSPSGGDSSGGGSSGGGSSGGGSSGGADPAPPVDTGRGGDSGGGSPAPPVSSLAGIAVNAAMGQLGVPYRFAAESPGVAFDCSGLTKYAWGQAGVYLPHQSGAQYGSVPHISQSEIQPGDLIFYKTPIGHVAIYIGGGQMIHAPRSGDVVSVAVVNWAKVVGIGRPG